MCEATTIAILGLAMSGYGMHQQAEAQQDMANYNAKVADNNSQLAEYQAQDATKRGDEEAHAIRRNADMLKGSQRASMSARGLDLAEGTAAELQDQTDFFARVDMTTARNNAAREAWGFRTQGLNYSSEAAMQRSTARRINPGMAAATSMLSGAGAVASKWYSTPTKTMGTPGLDNVYFGTRGQGD